MRPITGTRKTRLANYGDGSYFTNNMYYDGANWRLDNTAKPGTIIAPGGATTDTVFTVRGTDATSNPVSTVTEYIKIMADNGYMAIGVAAGSEPLSQLHIASGAVELEEMAEPDAPGSNHGRLFLEDNGSGKTRLAVRFPSGSSQILATEP